MRSVAGRVACWTPIKGGAIAVNASLFPATRGQSWQRMIAFATLQEVLIQSFWTMQTVAQMMPMGRETITRQPFALRSLICAEVA